MSNGKYTVAKFFKIVMGQSVAAAVRSAQDTFRESLREELDQASKEFPLEFRVEETEDSFLIVIPK